MGAEAAYRVDAQDVAVGARLVVARLRPGRLSALAVAASGLLYGVGDDGRLAVDLAMTSTGPGGIPFGVGVGPDLELAPTRGLRRGAHLAVWLGIGAVPFVRMVTLEGSGTTVEVGLGILLPGWRW